MGPPSSPPPPVDDTRWFYRGAYLPVARALSMYHRMTVEGAAPPVGPAIFVTLHGAGYFVLDLVLAGYHLAWKAYHERGAPSVPFRIVAAQSKIERALPGLPTVKQHFGIIDTSEASCLAVLERGEQLLVTPGGMREAQPSRSFYRLRWEGRYGFVRLALKTGAPIVPMAVVGGAEAYPGLRWGKLSLWSPVPLPARLTLALGEPIAVAKAPDAAHDLAVVKPIQERAWRETQALYDRLLARRKGP
ncbi:MAG TPA: lysophospholipid acyltransferase family protein [Anaeromyxobacteraceae bacterium]|nr:lysophospholipid acyltransferase family protein [Anaeromyxobacteraceae bacterium]